MLAKRIHSGIVKLRYVAQGCLVISALYGCATQAYAAYTAPEQAAPLQKHSPDELRTFVVTQDKKSLDALFVGKSEKLLQSYGVVPHPDLMGEQRYSYGYDVKEVYPGDSPNWPRSTIKGVEFRVKQGVVTEVSFFGYQ